MTVTSQSLPRLDPIGRCQSLEVIWPQVQRLVIAEFNRHWSGKDAYTARYRHRRGAFHDLARPGLPEPLHVGWEHEIFELCLQSVLNELPEELWRRGEPSDEILQEAADVAIPNTRIDIAIELSRCLRPPLARPREVSDAIHEVRVIDTEDEFNGWFRVGYREEEVLNEGFGIEQNIELASACVGLVAEDSGDEVEDVRIPFADAGGAELWVNVEPELAYRMPYLRGGLVSASFYSGFTSRLMLLAVHPVASAGMFLCPDTRLGPLRMMDQEGRTAVVLRVWTSEPINATTAGSIYRLTGCDLLMRPDCFAALSKQVESTLMSVCRSARL